MLVCKIVPSKQIGFVSYRGEALPKDTFEVLCGQNLSWQQCYDHVMPDNAVICGYTKINQPVYIGRGHYEGFLIVGKISSVHRALFIPFRGAERRLESYEVLVAEKTASPGWHLPTPETEKYPAPPLSPTPPPPPPPFGVPTLIPEKAQVYPNAALPPPYPIDEKPLYPSMMPQPQPQIIPAATAPMLTPKPMPIMTPTPAPMPQITPATCYVPPPTNSYDSSPNIQPAVCEPPPPYSHPAPSYPSHTNTLSSDIWANANPNYIPPNAVSAGHDSTLSVLYICRAFHEGNLIPGKLAPGHGCAYISHAGYEIQKRDFEVLIGNDKYHWVPSYNGNVVPGAVQGGRTANGEPLYVGRANYYGSLTPGKIQPSHGCLYIGSGGLEKRIANYEVLVRRDIRQHRDNSNIKLFY